jgi:ATP-dependent Clp protease ATP-binding subunit ClpA
MKVYREASSFERGELCRDAFTKHCNRPEISGKIGNFLVFDHLPDEARADVITKFIRQELRGYNLRLKTVDPHLMNDFISHETKYGARPLMALVSDALGEQLLTKRMLETLKGKRVSMRGTIENIEFDVIEGGQVHEEQQN